MVGFAPGGGGSGPTVTIPPWSLVKIWDPDTPVDPGDQDGSVAAPYSTLAALIAAADDPLNVAAMLVGISTESIVIPASTYVSIECPRGDFVTPVGTVQMSAGSRLFARNAQFDQIDLHNGGCIVTCQGVYAIAELIESGDANPSQVSLSSGKNWAWPLGSDNTLLSQLIFATIPHSKLVMNGGVAVDLTAAAIIASYCQFGGSLVAQQSSLQLNDCYLNAPDLTATDDVLELRNCRCRGNVSLHNSSDAAKPLYVDGYTNFWLNQGVPNIDFPANLIVTEDP
jgi:hypothetical protein